MNKIASVTNIVCSVETMTHHQELYHYTKPDAFAGILRTRSLWCSHYRDMVDKNEVQVIRDQLPAALAPWMDAIAEALNRHDRRLWKKAGSGIKVARDLVNALYGATFDGKGVYSAIDAYLCSFSTHAADTEFDREHGIRSQWENYAGPEGYCLVFDTPRLAQALGQEMDKRYWIRLTLDPVRYADAPVEQLFPELIEASADTLRQYLGGVREPEMNIPEFLAGATLLKDASYTSEREVRIVAIPGTAATTHRAAKEYPREFDSSVPLPKVFQLHGTARRYIALFDDLPIKRIIVGPGARQEECADLARSLVGGIPITLSKLPA